MEDIKKLAETILSERKIVSEEEAKTVSEFISENQELSKELAVYFEKQNQLVFDAIVKDKKGFYLATQKALPPPPPTKPDKG